MVGISREIYSPQVPDCQAETRHEHLGYIYGMEAYAVGTGTRRLKADNIWSYAV